VSKTFTMTLPHELTQDEARRRIEKGIADLRTSHGSKLTGVHEQWTGNRLDFHVQAMGQNVAGRVDVLPQHINVEVDLPWMLAMLAGKFQKQVETEGRKLLEKK
jgi:putative polyhydroxyalkanoate system protein